MIRARAARDSFGIVKKVVAATVVALALVASFWLGHAGQTSAHNDSRRPVTRGVSEVTEVLRVQEVQVDYEIDMHDGGQWEQPRSESDGG